MRRNRGFLTSPRACSWISAQVPRGSPLRMLEEAWKVFKKSFAQAKGPGLWLLEDLFLNATYEHFMMADPSLQLCKRSIQILRVSFQLLCTMALFSFLFCHLVETIPHFHNRCVFIPVALCGFTCCFTPSDVAQGVLSTSEFRTRTSGTQHGLYVRLGSGTLC